MKKSVYSLVLMDEVINEIDKLAYKANTNRSSMINRILADYLSMSIPQTVNTNIFGRLNTLVSANDTFIIQQEGGQASLTLKSALNYKYNPIVKYSVELYDGAGGDLGCVKASVRTQNTELINAMNTFFKIFSDVENSYIDFGGDTVHFMGNGKFKRKFALPKSNSIDENAIGEAISLYLENLDTCLKGFFQSTGNIKQASAAVENSYGKYLKKQKIII